MIKKIQTNDFFSIIFYSTVFLYPYVFIWNIFFPMPGFSGKNMYVSLITILMGLLFLIFFKFHQYLCNIRWILIAALLFPFCNYFLRVLFYDESFFELAIGQRVLMSLVIYASLAYYFVNSSQSIREKITNIIVINCVLQSMIGIVHHYIFPNVVVMSDFDKTNLIVGTRDMASREGGGFFNASIFSYFVILGLFVIHYRKTDKFSWIDFIQMIIMCWGIVLSQSRYPVFFAGIILIAYCLKRPSIYSTLALILTAIVGSFVVKSALTQLLFERLGELGSGRGEQNAMAIQILMTYPEYLLFGVPMYILSDPAYSTGNNSYFAIILLYGLAGFALWGYMIYCLLTKVTSIREYKLILLFMFGALAIVNCVYWDIWLIYFFLTLYGIQADSLHFSTDTSLVAAI